MRFALLLAIVAAFGCSTVSGGRFDSAADVFDDLEAGGQATVQAVDEGAQLVKRGVDVASNGCGFVGTLAGDKAEGICGGVFNLIGSILPGR